MFFEKYAKVYPKLVFIPIIILLFSIGFLVNAYIQTGDVIHKDVSLTGGVGITIYSDEDSGYVLEQFENNLPEGSDVSVKEITEFNTGRQIGFIIEAAPPEGFDFDVFEDEVENVLGMIGLSVDSDNVSLERTSSSLGESFYRQMVIAILIAFILMAGVVFIAFRNVIPSLAIVLSAFFDIAVTLVIIDMIGIKVSTAGIAAILLLLGYSIDTDILLTTKVLKRKEGSINERFISAMKTGLTMTASTVCALGVGYFVSSSLVLKQMFLVIIIGLLVDLVSTYIMNSAIIVNYTRKKEK